MISKFEIIRLLVGGNLSGCSDGTNMSYDDGQTPPTEEAIQAKLKELEKQYEDNEYQRNRNYPELGEQFDLLFKDINSGKVSKDGEFYKAIKVVKDAHPKPE